MVRTSADFPARRARARQSAVVLCFLSLVAGCAGMSGRLPGSGPTAQAIGEAQREPAILVVPITGETGRAVRSGLHQSSFAASLAGLAPREQRAGAGDTLEMSVWEAPPAMLFGVTATDPRLLAGTAVVTHLPTQVIDSDGTVSVPFAGRIQAAGETPRAIERAIAERLKGKTNQIQVLVRIAGNNSANVTVVGEVRNSSRIPISPAGERLLDVLAAAGGVTQPVGKMTVQITRGSEIQSMALDDIVRDARQNIVMRAGDVIAALHQPYSFSVLGAAGRNEEIPFEANGLSLAQALARSGGVNDNRADRRGVFVFRFEDRAALGRQAPVAATPDNRVPVVYQLELDEPASLLVAQQFPIRDKDVLYISNAPAAELQKFLNIVSSIATPILAVRALAR